MAASTAHARARSSPGPILGTSPGARFAVIRLAGNSYPELRIAACTRSRASRTDASPRPITENVGRPLRTSTSTHTARASSPINANVRAQATMCDDDRESFVSQHACLLQDCDGVAPSMRRPRRWADPPAKSRRTSRLAVLCHDPTLSSRDEGARAHLSGAPAASSGAGAQCWHTLAAIPAHSSVLCNSQAASVRSRGPSAQNARLGHGGGRSARARHSG